MSEIAVIGDEDTVVGFRLAGVKDVCIHRDADGTDRYIRESLERDVGVIIITDRCAAEVRGLLDRLRSERTRVKPIFVEIPDKRGPMEGMDGLQRLIRRVVGAEVTLEAR